MVLTRFILQSWISALKTTKVELELLSDINTLLIIEKGAREGTCHSVLRYGKDDNKYM